MLRPKVVLVHLVGYQLIRNLLLIEDAASVGLIDFVFRHSLVFFSIIPNAATEKLPSVAQSLYAILLPRAYTAPSPGRRRTQGDDGRFQFCLDKRTIRRKTKKLRNNRIFDKFKIVVLKRFCQLLHFVFNRPLVLRFQ